MPTKQTLVFERYRSLFAALMSLIAMAGAFYSVSLGGRGSGMMVIVFFSCGFVFCTSCYLFKKANADLSERKKPENWTLEDRIDELEKLKHDNLITSEEYAGCCLKLARSEDDKISKTKEGSLFSVQASRRTVEDRLDEPERLKRRDMVTPEEYAAKRQEILKDL